MPSFIVNEWRNTKGLLHRLNDKPAYIRSYKFTENISEQRWYIEGQLHRNNDNPSVIINGDQKWYKNGLLHRDGDMPAVIENNGNQKW